MAQDPGPATVSSLSRSWDFMWVYWYLLRFTGGAGRSAQHAIDVRSYAMGMRKTSFQETTRTYLPKRWFDASLRTRMCAGRCARAGRRCSATSGREPQAVREIITMVQGYHLDPDGRVADERFAVVYAPKRARDRVRRATCKWLKRKAVRWRPRRDQETLSGTGHRPGAFLRRVSVYYIVCWLDGVRR